MPIAYQFNPMSGQYMQNTGIGSGNSTPNQNGVGFNSQSSYESYAKTYGQEAADLMSGGKYTMPGSAPTSGVTSMATGGAVGGTGTGAYQYQNQLNQIRDDFRRMTDKGMGALNEDLNNRGIFSSGVGAQLGNDYRTQMGQQEMSAEERLLNDILGRNFQMDMMNKQFDLDKQLKLMGSGGGTKYGGANQNQQLMDLMQQLGMGDGGGSSYSSKKAPSFQSMIGGMGGGGMLGGGDSLSGLADAISGMGGVGGSGPMPTPMGSSEFIDADQAMLDAMMGGGW